MASEGLFRGSISWLASQTIFRFLILALYRLLKPVNSNLAPHMVVLLLVGVLIALVDQSTYLASCSYRAALTT